MGVKGWAVIFFNKLCSGLIMFMAFEVFAHIAVQANIMEEVIALENPMMLGDPVKLFRNKRLNDRGGNIRVVICPQSIANIMQQCHHDIGFISPIAMCAGGGLQAVRQPIYGKATAIPF